MKQFFYSMLIMSLASSATIALLKSMDEDDVKAKNNIKTEEQSVNTTRLPKNQDNLTKQEVIHLLKGSQDERESVKMALDLVFEDDGSRKGSPEAGRRDH